MGNVAIRVEDLSKRYRIGLKDEIPETLVAAMTGWLRSADTNFQRLRRLTDFSSDGHDAEDVIWALKDVSFDVNKGDVIGIIGPNGAGKTTLLKILSRITQPTSGKGVINGRVSSLLEVGTGFHPDLTGRENVFLNGTILGMSKAEVERKFDEIVEFSGVEKFIDTPVKRYSSGMQVRLAFSVAASLEPEILLVDEVLAVGDAQFQRKCLGKMGEVAGEGRTVLFVSHNMAAVSALCPRSIWLQDGQVQLDQDTPTVVERYIASASEQAMISLRDREDRMGDGRFRFVEVEIRDRDTGQRVVRSGSNIEFVLKYEAQESFALRNVNVTLTLTDMYNNAVFTCSTHLSSSFAELPSSGTLLCLVEHFPLLPGQYGLLLIGELNGRQLADRIDNAVLYEVQGGDFFGTGKMLEKASKRGSVLVRHKWTNSE